MLRSLLLLLVYVSFIGLSVNAPFVATLGYVWIDTFQPQAVAYILLSQLPVAMIMGALAFAGYILLDRRSPPPLSLQTILQASMAIWITVTLLWAQVPDAAWTKWNWAFKTVAFAAFIPFVIRSRVQIEAFTQIYVLALAANFVPFGLKVLLSGGGYGRGLGLEAGNSGLAEGGLLSTSCLMAVPLTAFLASHGRLIPRLKLVPLAFWGFAILAIATAVGTYERSALIGLIALGIHMWSRSRHKFWFAVALLAAACVISYSTSGAWNARISTIRSFDQENSAYGRILVWQWTLDFVSAHPMGGGFMAYLVDSIDVPATSDGAAHTEFGRAFHSIYFEVLGEHGYPGLIIFLLLLASTFVMLRRIAKQAGSCPDLQWVVALSNALQSGLVVFMTSGTFVGLAFQPMLWYFISLGICLKAYVRRVQRPQPDARTSLRGARPLAMPGTPRPPSDVRTGSAIQ